jgi:outer membrane protein OmpA-like peptidoglycan-associated protein
MIRIGRKRLGDGFGGCAGKLASAFALTLIVAGCSSTPDWANPMEWYRDASDAIFGSDKEESRASNTPQRETPGAEKPFPNLASVPERPKAESPERRAEVARSLEADRANARYSEERIQRQSDSTAARPQPSSMQAPSPAPVSRAPSAQVAAVPVPPPPPAASSPAPRATVPPPPMTSPSTLPSPAEIGPNPPSQPPQFAAPPPSPPAVLPLQPSVRRPMTNAVSVARVGNPTFGAPPTDIEAAQGGGSSPMTSFAEPGGIAPVAGTPAPQVAGDRAAIIGFKGGSARLNAADRGRIRQVASLYRQRGGAIRVEGHASSRTKDMDPVRHQMVNFDISLNRANVVARELVRAGVPESAVFVAAMSDTRPIYYEVMPAGDAGNQRVEIYFLN